MAFSPFTQPTRGPHLDYTPAIPFELYAQGLNQMSQDNKQAYQELTNQFQNIDNIPAATTADAQVLKQKMQEVRDNLSQVSMGNLRDPSTKQSVNNYLSQVVNDPDVQAIARRGYTVQNELKNKKEAESKGRTYISPALTQQQDYQNEGVYRRDASFDANGWTDPDIEKLKAEALKNVPKIKKQVLKNGYWTTVESYDPEALQSSLQDVYSHPDVQKTLQYNFNNTYKDVDFNTEGAKMIQNSLQSAQTQADAANRLLQLKPNDPKALQALQEANQHITRYQDLIDRPGKMGARIKDQLMQEHIQHEIKTDIAAQQFVSEESNKADEFAVKSQELHNDLLKETYKGLLPGLPSLPQEQQADFLKGDFSHIDIPSLQAAANQANIDKETAKAAAVATAKANAKHAIDLKIGQIKPADLIEINGTKTTYGAYKKAIAEDGDPSTLYKFIKENPTAFSEYTDVNTNTLKPEDITFDKSTKTYSISGAGWFAGKDGLSAGEVERTMTNSALEKAQANQPTPTKTTTNKSTLPTETSFKHKAKLGNDIIYSNDGTTWYTKDGKKVG